MDKESTRGMEIPPEITSKWILIQTDKSKMCPQKSSEQ
jgi:hypothetical protein